MSDTDLPRVPMRSPSEREADRQTLLHELTQAREVLEREDRRRVRRRGGGEPGPAHAGS